MATLADIQAKLAKPTGEPIEVPEWGVTLYARKFGARDGIELMQWYQEAPKKPDGTTDADGKPNETFANEADMVAFYVCCLRCGRVNESGEAIFNSGAGARLLEDQPFDLLQRLAGPVLLANGMARVEESEQEADPLKN